MAAHADFLAGVRAIAPLLPPGATVGLVTGLAASAIGLAPLYAGLMAVVVYSPTVMLTAFAMLESEAPMVILVAASLVVALRFMLLSLSISSYLDRVSTAWRWVLAYFLWTPVYALAIERFESAPGTDRRGFYLGLALPLWATFQASLLIGLLFGASVPDALQLGFVVPLAFIALLVRLVDDVPSGVAAISAGGLAVFGVTLPLNVGIVVAIIGGTAAGVLMTVREGW